MNHGTDDSERRLITTPLVLDDLTAEDRQYLDEILADLKGAADRIAAAGRKWVKLDTGLRQRIVDATPAGMRDVWLRLERVGMGTLHPQLATTAGIAARYLGRLPMSEQERYLQERIPVLVVNGREPDILRIDVGALSRGQRKQVFVNAGGTVRVRSIDEQRAWLADQAQREQRKEQRNEVLRIDRPGRWKVDGGKVYVAAEKVENGLTKKDVAQMLRDLQR